MRDFFSRETGKHYTLGMNYFDYMQSGYVCRDQSGESSEKEAADRRGDSRAFAPAIHVASRRN